MQPVSVPGIPHSHNSRVNPRIQKLDLGVIPGRLCLTPSKATSTIEMSPALEKAVAAYNAGNYSAAAHDFELLAASGVANACYYLGYMCQAGLHTEANEASAIDYYTQAIRFNKEADTERLDNNPKRLDIYFLGCLITAGFEIDIPMAETTCLDLASSAGNPEASRALASWIECNRSDEMAVKAYRKLADEQEVCYRTLFHYRQRS